MNIQPDTISNISDDQELAKALAGVNGTFEETPVAEGQPVEEPAPMPEPAVINPLPIAPLPSTDAAAITPTGPVPERGDLEQVKVEAINELRPLVDKLVLPPEEKFDVYLLLIRCTDDHTLIAPAHEVVKQIEDDTRRATALLDIIKEIDYLSNKAPAAPAAEPAAEAAPTPAVATPAPTTTVPVEAPQS